MDMASVHYYLSLFSSRRIQNCLMITVAFVGLTIAFGEAVNARLGTLVVTYSGNGHTGGTVPLDLHGPYSQGSSVPVSASGNLARLDYEFAGWNTASDGSGTRYLPAQTFIINASVVLYAQWILPPCFSNGSLDSSFGNGGKVTTSFSTQFDQVLAVAVQADSKIVAVGRAYSGSDYDFAVVRYNADGSLDQTFDGDGKVLTPVSPDNDFAYSVIIHPDQKILVGGIASGNLALVRYNPDGSLDTSFQGDGKVTLAADFMFGPYALERLPDGTIVASANANTGVNRDFAAVRVKPDGSIDTSFDGDGIVTTPVLFSNDFAHAIAVQPNGKIVVVGSTENGSITSRDFAVVRYNLDGTLDTSFDGDGIATIPILSSTDDAYSVAIQPDEKIVVAGRTSISATNSAFAVVRINPNGSLDHSFDGDGKSITPVQDRGSGASGVSIQPDGKIVASGYSYTGSTTDFAIVRYNIDGSLDTTFDADGKAITPVLNSFDEAYSLAIQPDGKLVAAGFARVSTTDHDFAIVRYGSSCTGQTPTPTPTPMPTPTPSPSILFSISGRVLTPSGLGVRNAVVSLIDAQNNRRTATTSSFGVYTFSELMPGSYTISVASKRYRFSPLLMQVSANLIDVDFTGLE